MNKEVIGYIICDNKDRNKEETNGLNSIRQKLTSTSTLKFFLFLFFNYNRCSILFYVKIYLLLSLVNQLLSLVSTFRTL